MAKKISIYPLLESEKKDEIESSAVIGGNTLCEKLSTLPFWCGNNTLHLTKENYPEDYCCLTHVVGLPQHPGTGLQEPLTPFQVDFFNKVNKAVSQPEGMDEFDWKRLAHKFHLNKGRQMGFTEIVLRVIQYYCFSRYAGANVGIMAATNGNLARKDLRRFYRLFANIKSVLEGPLKGRDLKLVNGTVVEAFPASEEALTGDTKYACIFLDEAAKWKLVDDTPVFNSIMINGESYDFKITAKYSTSRSDRTTSPESATPFGSTTIPPVITPTITVNPPTNLVLIPQDRSMVLEWETPIIGTTPTDYTIQYKYNFTSTWNPLNVVTTNNTTTKITDLYNFIDYDFKVASKVGDTTSSFTSVLTGEPTDKCIRPGADEIAFRCYATQGFSINDGLQSHIQGIQGTINFDDKDITSGFNGASYWLNFPDRKILEVGIKDDSTGDLEFFCAKDGDIQLRSWITTPQNNTNYTFEIKKQSDDMWSLTVNGELCSSIDMSERDPHVFVRGTETSRNNTPDFIQEFDSMKLRYGSSSWYNVQVYFGIDYRDGITYDYFIDSCGSTYEGLYHIETGKGALRNC